MFGLLWFETYSELPPFAARLINLTVFEQRVIGVNIITYVYMLILLKGINIIKYRNKHIKKLCMKIIVR